jgi:cyclopropane-fatty-acyl-phospholipid synthase
MQHRPRAPAIPGGAFSERYVFPDAAPLHVGRVIAAFELAALPRHVQASVRLRRDAAPLGVRLDGTSSARSSSPARSARARDLWRLYLRAARRGF